MNKVLLIDDEAYILDLLQNIIPWEFYGFEIAGTAENAVEAMKIFHKEQPQLIITDICMDNISGIEFITRVRMQNIEVKVIILSAYDKFEYAQKAMKLDVDGYLLKPIQKEELVNTILEVQKKLYNKSTYQEQIVSLQNSVDHFQKKYLEGQLFSIYKEEQKDLPKELNLPGSWCVLSIHTIIRNEIVFLERDLVGYSGITAFVLFVDNGKFAILLHGSPNALEQMEEVRKLVKQQYCMEEKTLLCGVSFQETEDLVEACQYSKEAFNWIFYEENIYYYENIKRKKHFASCRPKQLDTEGILLLLTNQETEKYFLHFEQYLRQCMDCNESKEKVIIYFCKCATIMKSYVSEKKDLLLIEDKIKNAENCLWKHEIRDSFIECISLIGKAKTGFNKASVVIANAQEYIKNNCLDESFSINTLASHLNISKSYLSKLYREETEESVWNFVIRVRITKAKEMLVNSDATNFMIAKTIGYSSEYHFSRAFSKSVGVSPSAYKKMYLQIK